MQTPESSLDRKSATQPGWTASAAIGAVIAFLLTGALVQLLEANMDFSAEARMTFWPVRVLIWAALTVYIAVPTRKMLARIIGRRGSGN